MEVKETKDYSIFKIHEGNRPLSDSHLKNLKSSIQDLNLLKEVPIIVDENFYVLDGQHRLKIAEELNIPIFYIVKKDLPDNMMVKLNISRSWRIEDFINYYCFCKNEEYLKIKQLQEENGCSISDVLGVLSRRGRACLKTLREGNFVFPENRRQELTDSMICLKIFREICTGKQFTYGTLFVKGLSWFVRRSLEMGIKIDTKKLSTNLELFVHKVGKRVDTHSYTQMILEIYNYRSRNPIEI